MKKQLLLLAITSLGFLSGMYAQINTGATFVNGTVSGYTRTTKNTFQADQKVSSTVASIGFGKAVRQNLIAGITATYIGSRSTGINTVNVKSKGYGGGLFARAYKQIAKSDFYFFGHSSASVRFTTENYDPVVTITKAKETIVTLDFTPGVAFSVNNWLQLETGLNNLFGATYQNRRESDNAGVQTRSKTLSAGFNFTSVSQIFVGFSVLINKKASS